jgi:hypothetical protein
MTSMSRKSQYSHALWKQKSRSALLVPENVYPTADGNPPLSIESLLQAALALHMLTCLFSNSPTHQILQPCNTSILQPGCTIPTPTLQPASKPQYHAAGIRALPASLTVPASPTPPSCDIRLSHAQSLTTKRQLETHSATTYQLHDALSLLAPATRKQQSAAFHCPILRDIPSSSLYLERVSLVFESAPAHAPLGLLPNPNQSQSQVFNYTSNWQGEKMTTHARTHAPPTTSTSTCHRIPFPIR